MHYIDGLLSVRDALTMMKEKGVDSLIIQKRNDADANGIITLAGIIRGVSLTKKTIDEVSIYEVMTKPVIAIPAHMNLKYVPRLMHNCNISVAPVEENGEYIGMINFKSILFHEV
jgi:signal-transduction protein with cAMP-binding, CBS, and nucleotidyltransferase domain